MKNKSAVTIRAINLSMALLATLGLSRPALATEPHYSYQQINVPGSAHTAAWGINDRGDIVGDYDTGGIGYGFLRHHGVFTTITVPGSIFTSAHGINNAGDIVGDFVDTTYNQHAYLLRRGQFTVIDFPGAVATLQSGSMTGATLSGPTLPPTIPMSLMGSC